MFCPSCGTQTETGIKYCKKCGLALNRIRGVMNRGGATESWNVWIQDELEKRKKSPEQKRLEEIKGGVITTAVGFSATFFLYFLMNAIASKDLHNADLLHTIWLVGLVPTMIGLAILFNGLFISRKIVELKQREVLGDANADLSLPLNTNALDNTAVHALPAADFDYSVTEHTTAKLKEKIPIPASRDTH